VVLAEVVMALVAQVLLPMVLVAQLVLAAQAMLAGAAWCSPKPQVEWFAVRVAFAPAMENATRQLPNVIASAASLVMCVKGNIALASPHRELIALVMVFARWAIASALQDGVWLHSDLSAFQSPKHVWTRSAQSGAVCMESASRANVFANKVGKAPTVRIHSVQMTVLVMASVLSSRCTALDSVSATMAGEALVARG
jgi:hypothetical protein